MGEVALDASVLIGFLDPADAHHEHAVRDLRRRLEAGDELLLTASAYAETIVQPLRDGRGELVDRFIAESGTTVLTIDRELARKAAELRARHRSLRLGDALVLAVAVVRGADLLTFDDRLRRLARRVGG